MRLWSALDSLRSGLGIGRRTFPAGPLGVTVSGGRALVFWFCGRSTLELLFVWGAKVGARSAGAVAPGEFVGEDGAVAGVVIGAGVV